MTDQAKKKKKLWKILDRQKEMHSLCLIYENLKIGKKKEVKKKKKNLDKEEKRCCR